MNKELSTELQKQIEQEAVHEASLHFHPQYSPDQNTACRINFNNGASRYASLWQAAEEKAEKAQHLIDATIEKVIDLMDFVAEAKGHVSDEEIISQVRKSLPELLEALTPKTGEDEKP